MRLLIVDDSSIMRRIIEKNLKDYDIEIIGMAADGDEAVKLVKGEMPDVITLDITMPGMDGLACLDQIMAIHPAAKVMIITALSDKLTGLRALDKGARGFLYKPVNAKDLANAFDRLLKRNKPTIE
ncbi:response regulator [Marinoscillum sp. MHG1-6]|uniref:response regulator n=1 Tax=Marinoscillum sp. MHG1-6 TaxID=2959627 RepID=UPI00215885BE|nr:response regulator [Marinoscillum sp. MHG1-6]